MRGDFFLVELDERGVPNVRIPIDVGEAFALKLRLLVPPRFDGLAKHPVEISIGVTDDGRVELRCDDGFLQLTPRSMSNSLNIAHTWET